MLAECDPGDLVLVALQRRGRLARARRRRRLRGPEARPVAAGAVVVDHGLQPGSARGRRSAAGEQCAALGLDPVEVVAVDVRAGDRRARGRRPDARYARSLEAAAERHGARLVLLGHTRDDQAEQVLLGLARGAGARSLAGMPRARGRFRRPLLGRDRGSRPGPRARAEGLTWWDDPMNEDPAFTRVRARRALRRPRARPRPGVAAALARTADQLREDADHLDALADEALDSLRRSM